MRWSEPLPGWVSSSALLALTAGAALLAGPALDAWQVPRPSVTQVRDMASIWDGRPKSWPSRTAEQPTPLGTPPTTSGDGTYSFEHLQDDGVTPVAYDPCRTLEVVVRTQGEPPGGTDLIRHGLDVIAAATGLHIVLEGTTDEAPAKQREAFQPERYGDRWAPALVAWTDPTQDADLAGDVAGLAGSVAYGLGDGPLVYVSGQVELDGPQLAELLDQPGGRERAQAVVEHELGHLVGLAHVDDPAQLMYPQISPEVTGPGEGDRTGLALLGAGACVPDV